MPKFHTGIITIPSMEIKFYDRMNINRKNKYKQKKLNAHIYKFAHHSLLQKIVFEVLVNEAN